MRTLQTWCPHFGLSQPAGGKPEPLPSGQEVATAAASGMKERSEPREAGPSGWRAPACRGGGAARAAEHPLPGGLNHQAGCGPPAQGLASQPRRAASQPAPGEGPPGVN